MADDLPILFSGPMVLAILEDRKNKTRRVITPQPPATQRGRPWCSMEDLLAKSKYQVGRRLWVREGWRLTGGGGKGINVLYRAEWETTEGCSRFAKVYRELKLDPLGRKFIEPDKGRFGDKENKFNRYGSHWHPSIHLPRWGSRLTLQVTAVGVERIRQINEVDAIAEGYAGRRWNRSAKDYEGQTAHSQFKSSWDKLNAKRGFGWDVNPWVWVVSFKRVS